MVNIMLFQPECDRFESIHHRLKIFPTGSLQKASDTILFCRVNNKGRTRLYFLLERWILVNQIFLTFVKSMQNIKRSYSFVEMSSLPYLQKVRHDVAIKIFPVFLITLILFSHPAEDPIGTQNFTSIPAHCLTLPLFFQKTLTPEVDLFIENTKTWIWRLLVSSSHLIREK